MVKASDVGAINEQAAAAYELWDDCQPPDGVHDLLLWLLYRTYLREGSSPREAQLKAAVIYKQAIVWRGAERWGMEEPVSLKNSWGEPLGSTETIEEAVYDG